MLIVVELPGVISPQFWQRKSTNLRHPNLGMRHTLDSTGPSTDPWGTPLITGFHMNIEPLTVTLRRAIQPILYPSNSPSIKPISLQFSWNVLRWTWLETPIRLLGKAHLYTHKGVQRGNGGRDGITIPCLTTCRSYQLVKGPPPQAQRSTRAQWQAGNPNRGLGEGHTPSGV